MTLKDWVTDAARAEGFDAVHVARAEVAPRARKALHDFLAAGHHGQMGWMAANAGRRGDPQTLWPEARSVIMLGLNYAPDSDPLAALEKTAHGAVSVYAKGEDYHDLIKKRLKRIARGLQARSGNDVKVFVDTAPVMEKPLAQSAGLGWQGKHTNLVSRQFGSWLFLGSIFTTADLAEDAPEQDHCGQCRACLDICPTHAFPAPYRLDARRCISYLTIEHKGHIDREFRGPMGNRIFGCDDCLAVCPWNKFARKAEEIAFATPEARASLPLDHLAGLDDRAFRALFAKSPVKRSGHERFIRNVLIAIGNSGDPGLAAPARTRLEDPSPVIRAMAVWALSQLLPAAEFSALRATRLGGESDGGVRAEWRGGETGEARGAGA